GEGEHAGTGADVEHPAAGEVRVLQQFQGERGGFVAAGAESGAGRQAEQPPSRGHFARRVLRLAGIEPERAADGERLSPLAPGGEPVGVGDGVLDLQLGARDHFEGLGLQREPRLQPQPAVRRGGGLHPDRSGHPEDGDGGVPPSPWPAKSIVDGLGTSLHQDRKVVFPYANRFFTRSMTPFSSFTGCPPRSARRRRIWSSSAERSRGLGTATSTVTTWSPLPPPSRRAIPWLRRRKSRPCWVP